MAEGAVMKERGVEFVAASDVIAVTEPYAPLTI